MSRVAFWVEIAPVGVNATYRRGRGRGFYKSPEAKAYSEAIRAAVPLQGLLVGPLRATLKFYFPTQRSDVDGPIKPTLDAMQGAAFANDRQVVELHVERHVDPARPRVEVVVEELQPGAASTPEALGSILGEKAKTRLLRSKGRLVSSVRRPAALAGKGKA